MATFLYRHFIGTVSIWQLSSTVTPSAQWVYGNSPLPSLHRHSEYRATFRYRHSIGTLSIWQLSSTVTSTAQSYDIPASFCTYPTLRSLRPSSENLSRIRCRPVCEISPHCESSKLSSILSSLDRPLHKPRQTIPVRVSGAYIYVFLFCKQSCAI